MCVWLRLCLYEPRSNNKTRLFPARTARAAPPPPPFPRPQNNSDIAPFIPGIVEGTETFESYLARMARPGTWGGEPELAAAAHVLGRPISVYSPGAPPQRIIT